MEGTGSDRRRASENSNTAQGFDQSLWEGYYLARNVEVLKEMNYSAVKYHQPTYIWL